jgi:ferredoxin-type protein NapH
VRRALQPFDITLRHGRTYQRVRRAFLAFSVALTVGLPLLHLHALDVEGAGRVADTRWAALASWLPSVAPPFLGAPTSVWVGFFELVDPLEALATALFRGVSWSLVWTVLPGVVLVLALGRFFCGWACPYLPVLAAANSARWLLSRLGLPTADLRLPRSTSRVVLVGVLIVGSVLGVQLVPLVYPPAVIGREAFRAVFYGSLGAGSLLVLAAFLFDTFVSRAGFCRSLCPGGAMFSTLGALSPIKVVNERSKCTDCTVCDVVCNLGQSPMNNRLDSGCERCGKCIAACPTKALSFTLQVKR